LIRGYGCRPGDGGEFPGGDRGQFGDYALRGDLVAVGYDDVGSAGGGEESDFAADAAASADD